MAPRRAGRSAGVRILLGLARVLATVVIAVAASAALADLDLRPVDFPRILPVILTGEAILYILVLGGGAVAGPVLLLTVAVAFALRFGIAVATAVVSPRGGGELMAGAQFYWASYWPAAAAQVLLVTLLLRLIKPLIARRRRRPRPRRTPEPAEEVDEERRELILATLEEAPDEPPERPTALEEQQIGDLSEVAEPPAEPEEEVAQELVLPFDEETPEPAEAAAAEEAAPEPSEEEPEAAEEAAPPEEVSERPTPVEDTATLEPVAPEEPVAGVADLPPPENLQEMTDVISRVAGDDIDVRVWATRDGRTVLAAVPAAAPAAGPADQADGLVRAHLHLCRWLRLDATSGHLGATDLGAYALQALDEQAAVLLLMAAQGEAAAGRVALAADRAADALRSIAKPAQAPGQDLAPPERESLAPDAELAAVINDASLAEGGFLADGWECYRTADGRPVAAAAPVGIDAENLVHLAADAAGRLEEFADAVALGAPRWLTVRAPRSAVVLTWHRLGGERLLLAAVTDGSGAIARTRWEMQRTAVRAGAQ
ncbi:MAG: hypothetical protein U9R79_15080 [Armatimonadota bacterium]|nr:hypothetical protein [Armatimonadota bacterium]